VFNWTSYNESLVTRGEVTLDFGIIDDWIQDRIQDYNIERALGIYCITYCITCDKFQNCCQNWNYI